MNIVSNLWLIGVIIICFYGEKVNGQSITKSDWTLNENRTEIDLQRTNLSYLPDHYKQYQINIDQFYSQLNKETQILEFPDPDGNFKQYEIKPSNVISSKVSDLYTIKTFIGKQVGRPDVWIACDISDHGFHATVYDPENTFIIEPLEKFRSKVHLVYRKQDLKPTGVGCHNTQLQNQIEENIENNHSVATNTKRTFEVGFVTSGEYSTQFGGNPYNATNVLNALASGLNSINAMFLRDLGIQLTLVSNAACVFQNAATDPFNLLNTGVPLADSADAALDSALGANGYDVGELIAWFNLGGIAFVGSSCTGSRGRSYSGARNTAGLWMDVVAHELGHQFGSFHNFSDECGGNSSNNFRFEPGGGSSVMSYGVLCGGDVAYINSQYSFFHPRSILSIHSAIAAGTGSCSTTDNAGNTADPVADAKANLTIPIETPFILVGSATDGNDPVGNLSYEWEQYNGASNATTTPPNCAVSNQALFRHYPPKNVAYRHFPIFNQTKLGNNNSVVWEKLPCVNRNMIFSFGVRDNNTTFGRFDDDRVIVTVDNSGPLEVIRPDGGESLVATDNYNVTWAVNGTDGICPLVDIVYSSDGGNNTFTVLADAVPNNGSFTITVPSNTTSTGRIIVQCDIPGNFLSQSTFYDISDDNFSIIGSNLCPNFLTVAGPITSGVYEADITVDSADQLMNSATIDFYGGLTVELYSGFEAPANTNFTAINQTCR